MDQRAETHAEKLYQILVDEGFIVEAELTVEEFMDYYAKAFIEAEDDQKESSDNDKK